MASRCLTLMTYVAISTVSASIDVLQEADLTFLFTSSCSDLINSEVVDVPYFHPIRSVNSYTPLRHLLIVLKCNPSRDIELPHVLKNNLGNPNLKKPSRPNAIFIPLDKSIGFTSETISSVNV